MSVTSYMYLSVQGLVDELRREAHNSCKGELDRLLKMENHVFTQDSSYQVMMGKHTLG